MKISMFHLVGDFGEYKDAAANLRKSKIQPKIDKRKQITLDFIVAALVKQSFVHAPISDVLRIHGEDALEYLEFQNCVDVVKGIISTVFQYSLETVTDDSTIEVIESE